MFLFVLLVLLPIPLVLFRLVLVDANLYPTTIATSTINITVIRTTTTTTNNHY